MPAQVNPPFNNPDIAIVFDEYPLPIREKLLSIRELIFQVASSNNAIGELEEMLKWGEPSYITSQTKSGSLIRMHHYPKKPADFSMFFHCGTNLVATFRERFPDSFSFGGNRSIDFMLEDNIRESDLKECIYLALTYNLRD